MQVEALNTPGAMSGMLVKVHDWASVGRMSTRGTASAMGEIAAKGMIATGSRDLRPFVSSTGFYPLHFASLSRIVIYLAHVIPSRTYHSH